MDTWFAKAETKTKDDSSRDSVDDVDMTSEFGALKLFKAIGNVTFTDSDEAGVTRIVEGQRIIYEGQKQLITVFGYLEGSKKTDAKITLEDRNANISNTSSSPVLEYNMRTEKVKIKSLKARGGTAGGGE